VRFRQCLLKKRIVPRQGIILRGGGRKQKGTRTAAESVSSWVSAPACLTQAHCFLPRTSFLKPLRFGGGRITASELKVRGGDVVIGLDGAEVLTLGVVRHEPAVDRDIVHIYTDSNPYPFQVTADHRLLVEDERQHRSVVAARDLMNSNRQYKLLNSTCAKKILDVTMTSEATIVIEVTFSQDACVLAWILPKQSGKMGRPPLHRSAATCCFGSRLRLATCTPHCFRHFGVDVNRTFLHGIAPRASPRRTRSADARLETL